MKFTISGKNIEVTPALRKQAIKKLSKLEKFFNPDTEAQVTMAIEKSRHIIEITIHFNGMVIRAEVSDSDMYTSLDKAIDKLVSQIIRNKTRLQKKIYEGGLKPEFFKIDEEVLVEKQEEEKEFKVVRSKKFAIKPMNVEEAILQMNLLGHTFFMFSNADTDMVNVVYKRKDGNYGLIEPEF